MIFSWCEIEVSNRNDEFDWCARSYFIVLCTYRRRYLIDQRVILPSAFLFTSDSQGLHCQCVEGCLSHSRSLFLFCFDNFSCVSATFCPRFLVFFSLSPFISISSFHAISPMSPAPSNKWFRSKQKKNRDNKRAVELCSCRVLFCLLYRCIYRSIIRISVAFAMWEMRYDCEKAWSAFYISVHAIAIKTMHAINSVTQWKGYISIKWHAHLVEGHIHLHPSSM